MDESRDKIERVIQALAGVVGTAFGLLWLLYVFATAAVIDSRLHGWEWWGVLLSRLTGPGLAAILVGDVITLTGLAILFTSFLPWRKSKKLVFLLLAFVVTLAALIPFVAR
jgi:hypothetical protein